MIRRCTVAASVATVALATTLAPAGAEAPPDGAPDPVIVVAGTGNDQALAEQNYAPLAKSLAEQGRDPHVFGLPGGGWGEVEGTADAFAAYVDEVLASTGAERVDLVGHSQGGVVARYYVRYLGGDRTVDDLVSLGAPHYGSELASMASVYGLWDCLGAPTCRQARTGSPFLEALNTPDDTWGDVTYTNVATTHDQLVVPYTNAFLRGDGTVNVAVQDQCPDSPVDHVHLGDDPVALDAVGDALAGRPVELYCGPG